MNPPPRPREIGRAGQPGGTVVIAVAGIHGNEPAGVRALERVHARLERESIPVHGELISLRGNLRALDLGQRFISRDLNRMWTRERVATRLDRWRRTGTSADPAVPLPAPEDQEQAELLDAIAPCLKRSDVCLIDLHTASATSVPFALIGDTLRNRPLAQQLPIPVLLGLEEHLEGSLLEAVGTLGHATLGVEGGQHQDSNSIDNLEAVVWLTLATAGTFGERKDQWPPIVRRARAFLSEIGHGYPRLLEVRHRHGIAPGDGFEMCPGFENFTLVSRGERLGGDHRGPVRSISDAHVLLPLYQGLGDDGFFLGRPIHGVRERALLWIRSLRLDWIVGLLPGVERISARALPGFAGAQVLAIDDSAPFLRHELLPALGYRRSHRHGNRWWMIRRPEWPPAELD